MPKNFAAKAKTCYDTGMTANDDAARAALSGMILSHSGWRGIFAASGDEEDGTGQIGGGHVTVATAAGLVFAAYLLKHSGGSGRPTVLVGRDTRPTGAAVAASVIPALISGGCRVRYAGVVAAPEIMAWARTAKDAAGFLYISASHNPVGHNGLKFGLTDGGVLSAEQARELTAGLRLFMEEPGAAAAAVAGVSPADVAAVTEAVPAAKDEAMQAYLDFTVEVARLGGGGTAESLAEGLAHRPLGVCCDFNGSARSASIDRDFLLRLGISFAAINDRPGEIAHGIIPEGRFLEPCCRFLEELHRKDPAFVLGYVPDCDGDRGNLVVWDEAAGRARPLEAQEVFALACVGELAFLAWEHGGKLPGKTAVAVNDPTSLRIERIAGAFGAEVFRAEVGEANVVGLARRLREEGYLVPVLGEGPAGGNITHPSAVRDPLHTVLAIVKLLTIRAGRTGGGVTGAVAPVEGEAENAAGGWSGGETSPSSLLVPDDGGASGAGLFRLWCNAGGGLYRDGFGVGDIIASLPSFATTGVSSPEALLKVGGGDALKRRYQAVFLREWERRRGELRARYGFCGWSATAFNGPGARRCGGDGQPCDFAAAGNGGLKICFLDADGRETASVWMRGSATEPVFRVMADAQSAEAERDLIEWQRRMTAEADGS